MTFSFWACTEGPIERRRELIKSTMFLNPEGKISMKDPDSTIYMVEDYGKVPAEAPRRVYIGPLVGVAQRATIKQFSLRSRKLIGNTVTLPPPPNPPSCSLLHASRYFVIPVRGTITHPSWNIHCGVNNVFLLASALPRPRYCTIRCTYRPWTSPSRHYDSSL